MRRFAAVLALIAACSSGGAGGDARSRARAAALDIDGHVLVMGADGLFRDRDSVLATARTIDAQVVEVAPFVFTELTVIANGRRAPGAMKGLAAGPITTRAIATHLVEGRVAAEVAPPPPPAKSAPDDPAPPDVLTPVDPTPEDFSGADGAPVGEVVLASGLARQLGVRTGAVVTLEVPLILDEQRTVRVTVSGVIRTDIAEYDRLLVLTTMNQAQAIMGSDHVLGMTLRLERKGQARRVGRMLQARLGAAYEVRDWCQLHDGLWDDMGC